MKKFFCLILSLVFLSALSALPATAADQSSEVEQLKDEVQKLLKRIEELEKRQTQTETKTTEVEKKAADAEKKTMQAGYDNGFYVRTADGNYSLKANVGIQFRYTYLDFDKSIKNNTNDWNNFFLRRARVFLSGNAPNQDWTYYFQIQLEPQSAVNLYDAYVTWKKYSYAQIQAGRQKIPYGLEFWNSGFLLNGVERTIFSGETDIDGKSNGSSDSRNWPGSNAGFSVSAEDSVTKFPIGGLNLFRSQGVQLQGDIDMFSRNGLLQYWTGIYNGRDSKGTANLDDHMLYVGRISVNPFGKCNLSQQGDIDYSTSPKVSVLISGFNDRDRLSQYRKNTETDITAKGTSTSEYSVVSNGYNFAGLFRYRGFSFDTEYGFEKFEQRRSGGHTWERMGYRFNAGYFLIRKKLELVARYAYVERLRNNTVADSNASGLGLVSTDGKINNAIEKNLQEYTTGLNYYILEHRLKLFVDYSYLKRELSPAGNSPVSDQKDHRYRTMIQYFF